jgi:hypothetical protein
MRFKRVNVDLLVNFTKTSVNGYEETIRLILHLRLKTLLF